MGVRGLVLSALVCPALLMSCGGKPSTVLIEDGKMTPEVLLAFGRLGDPQLSPEGSTILYGVTYNDLAADRSVRNLYACAPDGSGCRQITRYSSSVSNARWSPDGSQVFFLQEGQLWKAAWKGSSLGRREQLSDVPAGISGFKLSPDGLSVLYCTTIKNSALHQPSDDYSDLDKAKAYATEDLMYRHWDHWVTEIPRTCLASLQNGKVTPDNSVDLLGSEPYELPTEPFGGIEQLDWSPDGRLVAYSCRKLAGKRYAFSTNTDIFVYDVQTGATARITRGGGYDTDPVWSPDGRYLAWVSMARDGYEADQQRLFVAELLPSKLVEGQSLPVFSEPFQLASSLDRDVSSPVWHGGEIYFSALTGGVEAIYKVSLDDRLVRLTPAGWEEDFSSPFGFVEKDGRSLMLASYQSMKFPSELVAVDAAGPSLQQITKVNEELLSRLSDIGCESVYVKTVDGKDMQCWVLYPPEFDPSKSYPAIEIVLGGPQGTNSQHWSYRWCYRLMAQQGYIVILPNRRGTTAFGQEWKEQISGDYCGLNMQDYLSAGRYIKSKPYVDKLACVGASYGGYSAYMLEGLHGDLFDCFIAHAGIFDEAQLWYTTEEMWFANWDNGGLTEYAYEEGVTGPSADGVTFGGMQQAGAPYASNPRAIRHYANSPSSMVTKWHTPILCIHGMMDFRIPYEQGMAAFNAARMMGVPSKLLIFPEENHWILKPQNSLYWHRCFYDWLDRWMH
ncbi:MAG: S9 family peptidase [Bacteroidales bacterium]|nr:S9 family peptidase [Bacteroidales bacterium]